MSENTIPHIGEPVAPAPHGGDPLSDLGALIGQMSAGEQKMFELLTDPAVSEVTINSFDTLYYTENGLRKRANRSLFRDAADYERWIDSILREHSDSDYSALSDARGRVDVVEASLRGGDLYGSIHVCLEEITRTNPVVTVRKQPRIHVTLDQMLSQNMLDKSMRIFLEMAMKGRLNILVSGGSGAGKTTMVRALAQFIDPNNRVITAEEIDELHLQAPNVVSLLTHTERDERGVVLRRVELDDLVRHTLRMRPERVWVGEVRGREAYALVKACNTGHDGSLTTVHADTGRAAIQNLITYVMEAGVNEDVARDQIVRAFDLIVHIKKARYDRRVVAEITEVESVVEAKNVRLTNLWEYDVASDSFRHIDNPTPELQRKMDRYGVNFRDHFEIANDRW